MTRSETPTIHCDSEDGCTAWDVDYWAVDVSAVNGVRITAAARAPGWTVTPDVFDADLCPDCSPASPAASSSPVSDPAEGGA